MFNVANLKGDWQLSIRVADRDSGYVAQHYRQNLVSPDSPEGPSPKLVECVFDSRPNESFEGTVSLLRFKRREYRWNWLLSFGTRKP